LIPGKLRGEVQIIDSIGELVGRGRFRLFLLSRSALSCVDYKLESHVLTTTHPAESPRE
jgi:hypothetical protein